mmetsp:Transcript_35003/g.56718  ORF Transcript_35003/g.56718 Transcript_35003/m.56718 type:complete len:217 (+) Transcript_35003:355-1005(+)
MSFIGISAWFLGRQRRCKGPSIGLLELQNGCWRLSPGRSNGGKREIVMQQPKRRASEIGDGICATKRYSRDALEGSRRLERRHRQYWPPPPPPPPPCRTQSAKRSSETCRIRSRGASWQSSTFSGLCAINSTKSEAYNGSFGTDPVMPTPSPHSRLWGGGLLRARGLVSAWPTCKSLMLGAVRPSRCARKGYGTLWLTPMSRQSSGPLTARPRYRV